ncbi:MAG: urea ABC transporter substrate-binding protein [Halothiobacillaceae bacterium]
MHLSIRQPAVKWVAGILALLLGLSFWLARPQPPEPIRLGAIHSLSGVMAQSERGLVDGLSLAVDQINAAGGVLGRPLELIIADTRSDDNRAATEAARLIQQEKVRALFGCWTSSCRKAVRPVVEAAGHLLFYPVQYEGLEQSPNIIYGGSAPNQQILPGTDWAIRNFGPRLFLVGSDYVFPRTANRLIRDLAGANAATVVGEAYMPLTADDFGTVASQIRRRSPDVILNTVNGDSNLALFRALREQGLDSVPVISFSVAEPMARALARSAYHPNHYAVWGYFEDLDIPGNSAFVETFRAYAGADRPVSDPVLTSHLAVHLWAAAATRAGATDPERVRRNIGRTSIRGPHGPVAVDATTGHLWRQVYVGKADEHGGFTVVHRSERPLRPAPFPVHRSQAHWMQVADSLDARENNRPHDAPAEGSP